MTDWTEDYIHSLSIDPTILRNGQKLAQASKWVSTGTNQQAAWGLAHGSAKEPYRVSIDLKDAATKCSCPSRKFPCKHAIGLMLMLVKDAVPQAEVSPDWVTAWTESRQARQHKSEQASTKPKEVNPVAKAKREAARLAKVSAGIEELRLFLEDLARNGLDDPRTKSYDYWDRIAARMVDAQMQPLARRLRTLGGRPFQKKANWVDQRADEIGQLYALTDAYLNLDRLPEDLQQDVRAAVGFSSRTEEITATQPGISDQWLVVGQYQQKEVGLMERRTWLYGTTNQKLALILDFTHPSQTFTTAYPLGYTLDAEIVYYPSAYPQRAVVGQLKQIRPFRDSVQPLWYTHNEQILDTYADALTCNPFLTRIPAGLQPAFPTHSSLIDTTGKSLPLTGVSNPRWLQTIIGGDWMPVFGEWDGETFKLLSLLTTEGWISATNE